MFFLDDDDDDSLEMEVEEEEEDVLVLAATAVEAVAAADASPVAELPTVATATDGGFPSSAVGDASGVADMTEGTSTIAKEEEGGSSTGKYSSAPRASLRYKRPIERFVPGTLEGDDFQSIWEEEGVADEALDTSLVPVGLPITARTATATPRLSPGKRTGRSVDEGGDGQDEIGISTDEIVISAHMRPPHLHAPEELSGALADDPEAAAVWKAAKALLPSELSVEVPTPHGIWLMSRVPRPQAGDRESDLYVATPEIAAAKEGTKMWNHSAIRAFGSLHEVLRMRFEPRPAACKCSPRRVYAPLPTGAANALRGASRGARGLAPARSLRIDRCGSRGRTYARWRAAVAYRARAPRAR